MIALSFAQRCAEELVALFKRGDLSKIEIAGSVRRGKSEVKDIEIVAEPFVRTDLFGNPLDEITGLDIEVGRLLKTGVLSKRMNKNGNPQAFGPKYKALYYHPPRSPSVAEIDPVPLDLFIVRAPAQWGAVFAIRTGPGDYSKMLVTRCQDNGLRCEEGRLVYKDTGQTFKTPTEEDFIRACGVPWVEPKDRR